MQNYRLELGGQGFLSPNPVKGLWDVQRMQNREPQRRQQNLVLWAAHNAIRTTAPNISLLMLISFLKCASKSKHRVLAPAWRRSMMCS
jgi:hypothetical protein